MPVRTYLAPVVSLSPGDKGDRGDLRIKKQIIPSAEWMCLEMILSYAYMYGYTTVIARIQHMCSVIMRAYVVCLGAKGSIFMYLSRFVMLSNTCLAKGYSGGGQLTKPRGNNGLLSVRWVPIVRSDRTKKHHLQRRSRKASLPKNQVSILGISFLTQLEFLLAP